MCPFFEQKVGDVKKLLSFINSLNQPHCHAWFKLFIYVYRRCVLRQPDELNFEFQFIEPIACAVDSALSYFVPQLNLSVIPDSGHGNQLWPVSDG